ncbi:LPXTG cell wall anchor domain-containing protein [Nesterenkonia sp. F]|uniref:LPXTG cell wall anchor domain-containing protein n=1 Tax=Nesterenkonia sp. F TaxID=795955 RepID=UPI0002D8BF08|nr:LPXTG cell wall anchor domain-containing protein [Nesterenkonia sp. F]
MEDGPTDGPSSSTGPSVDQSTDPSAEAQAPEDLAETGISTTMLGIAAGALLLVGAAVTAVGLRRRRGH